MRCSILASLLSEHQLVRSSGVKVQKKNLTVRRSRVWRPYIARIVSRLFCCQDHVANTWGFKRQQF